MTQQQQEQIVMECANLAGKLRQNCLHWLHTSTNRREESAALELGLAADSLYSFLGKNAEIMGSDTGKAAFDEDQEKERDAEFQSEMNNFWEDVEP